VSRNSVVEKHSIGKDEKILLFNGVLDYKPNLDALKVILDTINPLLLNQKGFHYKIIICGRDLPVEMGSLKEYVDKNIIFAGFVPDIELYFKAADIFLNPVQSGGGIKTKMVEAVAFGTTVIATKTGAAGINVLICGNKLVIVADNDWTEFSKAILENTTNIKTTPHQYYDHYYWGNITKSLVTQLAD
jgi:polysaccharide biosynthesis protein PslH